MQQFNNRDIGYKVTMKDFQPLAISYGAMKCDEIVMECSPLHVQSVMEDMQKVILALLKELEEKNSGGLPN